MKATGLHRAVALIAAAVLVACGRPAPHADSPPAIDKLAAMLADDSAVNAIMGTDTMRTYYRYRTMPGWPQGDVYSRPECLALSANAMEPSYAGSHYREMRGTRLDDTDQAAQRNIDQAVVAFENDAAAQAFVAATVRAWKPCADGVLTITSADKPTVRWKMGTARTVDGVVVVDVDLVDGARNWRGSHALRAVNNVVIDVRVTGYRLTDQAVRLVNAIAGYNRL